MNAILHFRAETTCLYDDTFYIATDEDRGGIYTFPSSQFLDVPHHFTAVLGLHGQEPTRDNWTRNDEVQDLRDAYWKEVFTFKPVPGDEANGANAKAFAEALKPKYQPGAVQAPKEDEGMTVRELREKLSELGIAVPREVTTKADLSALLAKAKTGV